MEKWPRSSVGRNDSNLLGVAPDYRKTLRASRGCDSDGQYGHLKRAPLEIFSSDSLAMTWPHGIIIGGFWSVPCSFETGQTKMEWKW